MFYNKKFNLFLAALNNLLVGIYVFLVEFRTKLYFQSPPHGPPLIIFFFRRRALPTLKYISVLYNVYLFKKRL